MMSSIQTIQVERPQLVVVLNPPSPLTTQQQQQQQQSQSQPQSPISPTPVASTSQRQHNSSRKKTKSSAKSFVSLESHFTLKTISSINSRKYSSPVTISPDSILPYVPIVVQQQYAEYPHVLTGPLISEFQAAVLFCDVSGFTKLSASFAEQGPVGMEKLSKYLNEYFSAAISLITPMGGDVIKFAGDAMQVIWPATSNDSESLRSAVRAATACAVRVVNELNEYSVTENLKLYIHAGVGAGKTYGLHIGGYDDDARWEYLIAGESISQLSTTLDVSKKGEVSVSKETLAYLDGVVQIARKEEGGIVIASKIINESEIKAIPLKKPDLPPAIISQLSKYVPSVVLERAKAGQGQAWLAELRLVTTVFISLPTLTFTSHDSLDDAQGVILIIQAALSRFEGTLRQFICDDKGTVVICAFGLPPLAHENDAMWGLKAAVSIRDELKKVYSKFSIGITTGKVFAGNIGSDSRKEYAMTGDAVNMSARLMASRLVQCGIVVDDATYKATRRSFDFITHVPIMVKGKDSPISVYTPTTARKGVETGNQRRISQARTFKESLGRDDSSSLSEFVGRKAEFDMLNLTLNAMDDKNEGFVILIEGEPGMGKSSLIDQYIKRSLDSGFKVVAAEALDVDQKTMFYVWAQIFTGLFQDDADRLAKENAGKEGFHPMREAILMNLANYRDLYNFAPLLNSVLHLDIAENNITQLMKGAERRDKITEMIVSIITLEAQNTAKGLILMVDDCQWMDSSSWEVIQQVTNQSIRNLCVCMFARPLYNHVEWTKIMELDKSKHSLLSGLNSQEINLCIRNSFNAEACDETVSNFLFERTHGNCLFLEQLVKYLLEGKSILNKSGHVYFDSKLNPENPNFNVNTPTSINGLILSRFDKLKTQQQLILKIASCIGRIFDIPMLIQILAHDISMSENEIIKELLAAGLVFRGPRSESGKEVFVFESDVLREVIYTLMVESQRVEIHTRIAEWIEATTPEHFIQLSFHWQKTNNYAKQVMANEGAAKLAMENFSYREAIKFFEDALKAYRMISMKHSPGGVGTEEARKKSMYYDSEVGKCYAFVGDYARCVDYLANGLEMHGIKIPNHRKFFAIRFAIYKEYSKMRKGPTPKEREAMAKISDRQLAEINDIVLKLSLLMEACFFLNYNKLIAWIALKSINLCESLPMKLSSQAVCFSRWGFMQLFKNNKKEAKEMFLKTRDVMNSVEMTTFDLFNVMIMLSMSALACGSYPEIIKHGLEVEAVAKKRGNIEKSTANFALAQYAHSRACIPYPGIVEHENFLIDYLRKKGGFSMLYWITTGRALRLILQRESLLSAIESISSSLALYNGDLSIEKDLSNYLVLHSCRGIASYRAGGSGAEFLEFNDHLIPLLCKMDPPNFAPMTCAECYMIGIIELYMKAELEPADISRTVKLMAMVDKFCKKFKFFHACIIMQMIAEILLLLLKQYYATAIRKASSMLATAYAMGEETILPYHMGHLHLLMATALIKHEYSKRKRASKSIMKMPTSGSRKRQAAHSDENATGDPTSHDVDPDDGRLAAVQSAEISHHLDECFDMYRRANATYDLEYLEDIGLLT